MGGYELSGAILTDEVLGLLEDIIYIERENHFLQVFQLLQLEHITNMYINRSLDKNNQLHYWIKRTQIN